MSDENITGLEKARKRIRECINNKGTFLSLHSCNVKSLDDLPKLKKCSHITELNLSHNDLSDLTP